ncbi:hypothetical protein BDL97_13G004600 [Sphagnum fallax]|nr:hypothetical protein BDL97_13G004600 [Sphagnum fallax]
MVSKLGFFFWHKLFAIYYTLSGGRLVETPLLMQNLCLKLSLYFNRSYFTALKWPAKTNVGKATMKKPRSKMVAAAVRFMIANKAQMMPSETDELHEPLFQTVGTFLNALFY